MTVREYLQQVNLILGAPELQSRRIIYTVSVGQDFGHGDELSAVIFYLDTGLGVRPDAKSEVCIADGRCEDG